MLCARPDKKSNSSPRATNDLDGSRPLQVPPIFVLLQLGAVLLPVASREPWPATNYSRTLSERGRVPGPAIWRTRYDQDGDDDDGRILRLRNGRVWQRLPARAKIFVVPCRALLRKPATRLHRPCLGEMGTTVNEPWWFNYRGKILSPFVHDPARVRQLSRDAHVSR